MSAMRRMTPTVVALLGALACGLVACGAPAAEEDEADLSGVTRAEERKLSPEERYARAGNHYAEFNERVAEVQREISEGPWIVRSWSTDMIPDDGTSSAFGLQSADWDETYFFTAPRRLEGAGEYQRITADTLARWREKGWSVSPETVSGDGARVTATTEDGYWFELFADGDELVLDSTSPVYWGRSGELIHAIADRREAEDASESSAGLQRPETVPLGEDDWVLSPPGTYRPFPAWGAALPDAGKKAAR